MEEILKTLQMDLEEDGTQFILINAGFSGHLSSSEFAFLRQLPLLKVHT